MKKTNNQLNQYQRAQKRVDELKRFYKHLTVYIIVNGLLLLLAGKITFILLSKEALGNPEFLEWVNWNLYGTPIIWGVALIIHATYVFMSSPFKKWEEKKIKAYMDEERSKTDTYV